MTWIQFKYADTARSPQSAKGILSKKKKKKSPHFPLCHIYSQSYFYSEQDTESAAGGLFKLFYSCFVLSKRKLKLSAADGMLTSRAREV